MIDGEIVSAGIDSAALIDELWLLADRQPGAIPAAGKVFQLGILDPQQHIA